MPNSLPLFCGNGEKFGDGTPALKLSTNRPLVYIQDQLPNFNKESIWSWLKEAYARWEAVCDFRATRIMDLQAAGQTDVVNLITVEDLGGSGILADQMLPYQGGRILRMRINARINWKATDGPMQGGTIDPIRTLCHEIGHFMGHSHWPVGVPLELMEPSIQQNIISPQSTEAAMSASWFGKPATTPTPPPIPPLPPVPTGEVIRILMDIGKTDGSFKSYKATLINGLSPGGIMDPQVPFPTSTQFFDSAGKLLRIIRGEAATWSQKYGHVWIIAGYGGTLIPQGIQELAENDEYRNDLEKQLELVQDMQTSNAAMVFDWKNLVRLALQYLMNELLK